MNVVDSSGWLEYFANGPNAGFFAGPIRRVGELIVPTVSVFEVFKRLLQLRNEDFALQATAAMHQGILANLDGVIALDAARLSVRHRLPMADSIMLATAHAHNATLWTQDADFKDIAGVRYREREG